MLQFGRHWETHPLSTHHQGSQGLKCHPLGLCTSFVCSGPFAPWRPLPRMREQSQSFHIFQHLCHVNRKLDIGELVRVEGIMNLRGEKWDLFPSFPGTRLTHRWAPHHSVPTMGLQGRPDGDGGTCKERGGVSLPIGMSSHTRD